jgi:hypothetical protein
MNVVEQKVIKEVLHLPLQSRAFIAEKLLESLDIEKDFELSEEWYKEIVTRCQQIDNEEVVLLPAEEVLRNVYKALK